MRPFDDRPVLVVVTGGIAAYKTAYLVRRLREAGAVVDVVLTRSAERFVGRATFEGLTGRPIGTSLWERPLDHIDVGRRAGVAIVAPATADFLAKLATGQADSLAAATLLAAPCPVLLCPAMNQRMWRHPATQHNVDTLREFGLWMVGPDVGQLAEGEIGIGRMSEPVEILAVAGRLLEEQSLKGRKVVVTAGPTRAPIDPVRYVGNRASGHMGQALAASAWRRGASVTLVSGPTARPHPHGPHVIEVDTAEEMLDALREALEEADLLLMAAAVSDFRVPSPSDSKIKKTGGDLELHLVAGPDLLKETRAARDRRGIVTLGFALETDTPIENGREKLTSKGVDFMAVNEVGDPEAGFEVPTNRITLLDRWGEVEELPVLPKEEVADRLLDRIEARLD
ncbi:MAG: bifunctional phosphopantothenoylcysteine decarboxylase/phosphopantothenate--cysteine ligase CoaBC [Gemmatimonadetes bacterium]|nr:bifunctional phosphopantothenoylcysteine decarboxylase/phosphopantothenate--cysteine ligase CoaBC [Gemmatimonadota bacterium]